MKNSGKKQSYELIVHRQAHKHDSKPCTLEFI